MSDTTSVPAVQFTDAGFVPPPESAIVTGLNADWAAAFGGNLNTDPKEPAGQLISSEAAVLGDSNDQQVLLFNGVDPAYASGRMQDAIARIYFLERDPAEPTALQITCTGLNGVIIQTGAAIQDASGNIYFCTAQGTIPISGTITLPFAAQIAGPTPVPASNGVSIYQAIPGWNTVAVASGIVGNVVESRAAFEARRAASVAINAIGYLPAIRGAVLAVPGVLDAYVTENDTGSAVITGGVSLVANSLYVCVSGGANLAVATAIWNKKPPGCAYTGNTTVTVFDNNSGYSIPPAYSVTFEEPTFEAVAFIVVIANSSAVPANAVALVQGALSAAFNGTDGGPRAQIGSTIYASRFYAGVSLLGTWARIVDIQLGTNANPACAFTASLAAATLTVTAVADAAFTGTGSGTNLTISAITGTIYPGYVVSGTGVPSGTTIVSQSSGPPGGAGVYVTSAVTTSSAESLTAVGALAAGQFVYGAGVGSGTLITAQTGGTTGGIGTYTVALSQTVTSEAMTSVSTTNNSVSMFINQAPTFAPPDVNLVLR